MLQMVLPRPCHQEDVQSFYREMEQNGDECIGFANRNRFDLWLTEMQNRHLGKDLPAGYVREKSCALRITAVADCGGAPKKAGKGLLSFGCVVSLSFEPFHGADDFADGKDGCFLFISGIRGLFACHLYILQDDTCGKESCRIPKAFQSGVVRRKNFGFCCGDDVCARIADSDDFPFFKRKFQLFAKNERRICAMCKSRNDCFVPCLKMRRRCIWKTAMRDCSGTYLRRFWSAFPCRKQNGAVGWHFTSKG